MLTSVKTRIGRKYNTWKERQCIKKYLGKTKNRNIKEEWYVWNEIKIDFNNAQSRQKWFLFVS